MNFGQVDMQRAMLLLVLALAAPMAGAQIYRSVMPDGRIVYGDKPTPGARNEREVDLPPPNIALPEPVRPSAAPRGAQGKAARPPLDAAHDAAVRASADLDAARAALEAGREPQAGEMIGSAITGSARHTEAYVQRIKSLEDAVEQAKKRLDQALDRRNALR